jgi:hypothetical protein
VLEKSTLDLILALPADMTVMEVQLHLPEMCHSSFQTSECVNWEKLEMKAQSAEPLHMNICR